MGGVCVLGSANLDIVARVEHLPAQGETIFALGVERFAGGKGLNQAIAAARIGADVRFIGAIGDDESGVFLRQVLMREGVNVSALHVHAGEASGQAMITVSSKGHNTIVVSSGANSSLSPGEATVQFSERVFLAQLENPLPAMTAFFSTEIARSGTKILNAAPASPDARALFPLIDILILNEVELAQFAGSSPVAVADVVDLVRRLEMTPDQLVVVTLGSAGVMAVANGKATHVPAQVVTPVDTTGAGDCFCGAFAASLAQGIAVPDALRLANRAAAISVTRRGAAASMPFRRELDGLTP